MLLLWEDLKKHCEAFKFNFHLWHLQFVIISDFEEEKHVKKITTEVEKEVEQPTNFSLVLVEGGFFDIKINFPNIHVVVPTKARSKYMMRPKGKEHVEKGSSPTKMAWK